MIDWTTLRIDLDKTDVRFLHDILDAGLRLEVEEETVDEYPEAGTFINWFMNELDAFLQQHKSG